ncbi:ABC transporter ATP-binding protein [Mycolicibacterium celeriflavum]|uniref:ABC transporter ATP-binding protein n=1 Tax=Mycolicibacterium celeriflavum TaxID=1249101 RepID=A0A1X0BQW7_MYCCF|nr:ABC transporter ATP-binding protein [Mycolicibacterium celeriflavum]MCV7237999.1 ABC transporter ATP-binding protein [Mycolicibacterium celeriflavum]ORA45824.1 histidinol phosphatase [Mycolicibacterium celeriflavum]BBY45463.1 ABC transporter ATP-binding protein [Mycolicibacterium celeriflavum]
MTGRINIDDVTVSAGRKTLIRNVSLHAGRGEMVGVVGPNGAGKTTLLRTLYRAQRPTSGRVLIDGDDVWRMSAKRAARRLAAVLQDTPGDFELTVFDVVAMGRSPYKRAFEGDNVDDRGIIAEALDAVDISALAHQPFDRVSGGQKQRVLIARALAQRTDTIVLDEPTNHLDLRHQHDALHLLRTTGATVVAALHDLNLAAAYCDRICVLDCGSVVATGTPAEVLTVELLAQVYGVDARVDIDEHTNLLRVAVAPKGQNR